MSADTVPCSCKVGRVIEAYELSGLDDAIRVRRETDEASLRTLAEFVNTRVLRRAIERDADSAVLADATSLYSALTGDADSGTATELRTRLSDAGVPVEDVTADFVSHQTVRTHLRDCLDMETGRSQSTDIDEVADLIEWARNRDERIIDRAIARLRDAGELDIGDTNVIHSVRVICEDCGESHRLRELLDGQTCGCGRSS